VPGVADRRENPPGKATQGDSGRREVLASRDATEPPRRDGDAVEIALADALSKASEAGRFDVVAQLAGELEARRRARASNVVPLAAAKQTEGA
jgi:hypothetical protein